MSFSPSNQPFKDDIELKSDMRSETLDTRQEYDLKVRKKRILPYTTEHRCNSAPCCSILGLQLLFTEIKLDVT